MLTKWHHLIERKCNECGTAWLLSGKQARFFPGRPRGRMPIKMTSYEAAGQFTSDAGLEILDNLKSCPNCGAQTYTDRAVTDKMPGSPGVNRAGLDQ